MDDYHKVYGVHEADIEEWHKNYSPNYLSIAKGQLATSMPIPLTIITRVSARPSIPRGSGNDPTIKAWALHAFNLVTKFFEELCTNY
jgi:hypothetical protein